MIYAIVSCNQQWQIGEQGAFSLPWRQKEDMLRFKRFTENSIVVMGSRTAESFNWKPLKNRVNAVLTGGATPSNWLPFNDIDWFMKNYNSFWVIGGGRTYDLFLPHIRTVELTRVFTPEMELDAYFPALEAPHWIKQNETGTKKADKDNEYPYRYETWVRSGP